MQPPSPGLTPKGCKGRVGARVAVSLITHPSITLADILSLSLSFHLFLSRSLEQHRKPILSLPLLIPQATYTYTHNPLTHNGPVRIKHAHPLPLLIIP